VALGWRNPGGLASLTVYRSTPGGSEEYLATLPGDAAAYEDAEPPEGLVTYRVATEIGHYSISARCTVVVGPGDLHLVCGFSDEAGANLLSWEPGPYEHISIRRRTVPGGPWGDPVADLAGHLSQWVDTTGLARWQEYRVVAYLMPPAPEKEDRCAVDLTEEEIFLRGDANRDGSIDISDAISILGYLFSGGGSSATECRDALDANDDEGIDISDAIYLLGYLYGGGAPPPAPHPRCGHDPAGAGLDCPAYPLGNCPGC
jgi:hypothetical protein